LVCGLLLRTVLALRKVPLGFRIDHVALAHPQFPGYTYKDKDMQQALYGPLIERIRAVHGVQSAALTTVAPLNKEFSMMLYMSYGDTDTDQTTIRWRHNYTSMVAICKKCWVFACTRAATSTRAIRAPRSP
jgi:hypothetical protein